jgi:hypothetical protein
MPVMAASSETRVNVDVGHMEIHDFWFGRPLGSDLANSEFPRRSLVACLRSDLGVGCWGCSTIG